ncbi:UNVERIFIED_CONTAM: protein Mo25 [Sesamum calycinum]|uniref:Protein Mo25 n=1 Tax=Sesamum calycinum TaxID=2727403 RepID=A0AAW2QJL0_9LAMI
MSFFFRQSRPKTPQELVKAIKDSLMALDSQTVAEVKALEKALEEVEKNIVAMRVMLTGDGEAEPSADQISQLTLEICNQDAIPLLFDNLPILGWEDLLTKHPPAVSEFLTAHYNELLSEFLLESRNSHIMKRYIAETNHLKLMMILLKLIPNNFVLSYLSNLQIFVANPNKPQDIKVILAKNHEKLLALLQNLSPGKGDEDDEFEEEKEMIMKEIQRLATLPNLIS